MKINLIMTEQYRKKILALAKDLKETMCEDENSIAQDKRILSKLSYLIGFIESLEELELENNIPESAYCKECQAITSQSHKLNHENSPNSQ